MVQEKVTLKNSMETLCWKKTFLSLKLCLHIALTTQQKRVFVSVYEGFFLYYKHMTV